MPLSTAQATFTRYADGSLHVTSSGGVDPLLSGDESASLETYISGTTAALADAVAAVEADVTAGETAVTSAAHAAAVATALAKTEVVPAP